MNDKQIDIFGNEISLDEIEQPIKGRMSIKDKFRYNYGYDLLHNCKNCKYFREFDYNYKRYFKCEMLGITSSAATDIRKKDIACKLYKEVSDKNVR